MTKDELIAKQRLRIEECEYALESGQKILQELTNEFYAIGAPLNDNMLNFNGKQLEWCHRIAHLINLLSEDLTTQTHD